jgi:hypothetical protein
MIYFFQEGQNGPIKVGFSVDTAARLRTHQTSNSEPLRVIAVAPGDRQREAEIKRRLKPHLKRGEWFHPVPEVFALIKEIQTPEYKVEDLRAYAVLRRDSVDSPTRPCPFCGLPHTHGLGDNHRVAHCGDDALDEVKSGDVTLRRSDGYFLITDG